MSDRDYRAGCVCGRAGICIICLNAEVIESLTTQVAELQAHLESLQNRLIATITKSDR